MEAGQQSQALFDEIVYLSPAFPMFHQDSQPIIFGMRLRDGDRLSMEAITVLKSLIARGVDWVHFVKCMALPSAYRNYQVSTVRASSVYVQVPTPRQTAKHANELEQGWSLGSLWRNNFIARLSAQESAQLLLVRPKYHYHVNNELCSLIYYSVIFGISP